MATGDRLRAWWPELGLQLPAAGASAAGRLGNVLGSRTLWPFNHGVQSLAMSRVRCGTLGKSLGYSFLIVNFKMVWVWSPAPKWCPLSTGSVTITAVTTAAACAGSGGRAQEMQALWCHLTITGSRNPARPHALRQERGLISLSPVFLLPLSGWNNPEFV